MRIFPTQEEASTFMESTVDRPVAPSSRAVGGGVRLTTYPLYLGEGSLTNVYDICWPEDAVQARIHVSPHPMPVRLLAEETAALVTASGGFFFLADHASSRPTTASLNLAVSGGRVLSAPVSDREALICRNGRLSMRMVRASGELVLNGAVVRWAGSRTGRAALCHVYGNGNAVIERQDDPATGSARVLNEASRYTPALSAGSGRVDVAFRANDRGGYVSTAVAVGGGMDIFTSDLVVRCPSAMIDHVGVNVLRLLSIGDLDGSDLPDSALSVGPALDTDDFASHPTNHDPSMGRSGAFDALRLARLVVFQDTAGWTHLRLFDGRPGSTRLTGVTPAEAAREVSGAAAWGCFLDGGQTARIGVVEGGQLVGYGNRHYLQWPTPEREGFGWVPNEGRPVGSVIALQQ